MIVAQDVFLGVSGKTLFEKMSFRIGDAQRVGVVGRNGVGKSTLFKLLQHSIEPDQGEITLPPNWRISQLFQEVNATARAALDWAVDGDATVRRLQQQMSAAEQRQQHDKLASLYAEFEDAGGYDVEVRARNVLTGLGFANADLTRAYTEFSGGWRIRLNLAQALMCPSDLLLLDEPTNHLDLDATLWLESFLKRYPGTLMVISHDRDFLNNLATNILHLEHGQARLYRGNYDRFERTRAEQLALASATYRKQQQQRARIEAFVTRFRAKASKAKQVQSRVKSLAKLSAIAPAYADSPYDFEFPNPHRLSDPLLKLEHCDLGYDALGVLSDINLTIRPGNRIGILGANGTGKSTLIKTLAGELMPLGGEIQRGKHAQVGYFAQHQMESLQPRDTPLRLFQDHSPLDREQTLRNYLGSWGISGAMADRPVEQLSGGEKARLVLALIAWQKPTLLLLDEPTNHLDLEMRLALAVALQSYQGALLLVSHDRSLMNQVVDEFWLTKAGSLENYNSDLANYTATRAAIVNLKNESDTLPAEPGSRRKKRQNNALLRQQTQALRNQIKQIEHRISTQSQHLKDLEATVSDPDTYAEYATADLAELVYQQGQARKSLGGLEDEWLELQEQLEVQQNDLQ